MAPLLHVAGLMLFGAAAGVFLVVQVTLNGALRSHLGSWAWAGLASYVGGTLAMILLLAFRREAAPGSQLLSAVPTLTWTGGVFGAAYLVVVIVLLPRLGAATLLACVVTGQMIASVAFDHFGILCLTKHPLGSVRALGGVLLVAGVVLMRT